ncbi:hypothetical protein LEP1GSC070_0954 [Leptospira santarosai str. AIM]|nr:hypothetical protein LEP1GSC070_0954 [Leptospira santarosai str. AIM]
MLSPSKILTTISPNQTNHLQSVDNQLSGANQKYSIYSEDISARIERQAKSNDEEKESKGFLFTILNGMNGGSGSMGQRFTQAVRSEAQSRITGAVAEATGLPASLVGALVGGSSMKDAVKAYVKDETTNAISKATGIPAWMISNQMEKMNKPKEQWYQSQTFQMVTTVVAVAAAPFTGGASLLVAMSIGAGIGAATGAASGGLKGALVGAVGGAAGAAVKSFTGGAVTVGLSYSAENGFGASVGVGYGPATVSVGISERGGTTVDLGLKKGGFNAGLSYNSKTGSVSGNAGFTSSQSGTGFALSYNEGDGFGASISKSLDSGVIGSLSWSEKGGVGGSIGYEAPGDKNQPKNSLANQMKGAGGSLSFNQRDGVSASVSASGGVNAGNWSQSGGFQANTNFLNDQWKADFVSKQDAIEQAKTDAESKAAQDKNNQETGKSVLDGAAISTQRREGETLSMKPLSHEDIGDGAAYGGTSDGEATGGGKRSLSSEDKAAFWDSWKGESRAQTDASIAELKKSGYDTSEIESKVKSYRDNQDSRPGSSTPATTTTQTTHQNQPGVFQNILNSVVGGAKGLWDKMTGVSSSHVISTGPEHYDTVTGNKLIYKLHEEGPGFKSNSGQDGADDHRYGQKALVDTISNTINEWTGKNPGYPIVTNDLGYKTGGYDPRADGTAEAKKAGYYQHHKDGNAIDLSYMVTPGVTQDHVNYDQNTAYNRDKTIEYIKTISRNIPEGVKGFVKFNDPAVHDYFDKNKLPNLQMRQDKDFGKPGAKVMHSNHLHLELELPKVK